MAKIRDCFGMEYEIARMPTNGLCGFHSLAYALTGDRWKHEHVIEDLLAGFFRNPQLFVLQTEFGKRNGNLSVYERAMRNAVANVHRQNVNSLYWMEDGHIMLFSKLYDVSVYVYHLRCKQWYVYGSGAGNGYICLLASDGHFDVLEGVWPCKPAVPRTPTPQGLSRDIMVWQPVPVDVQRYSYARVSKWDNERAVLVDSDRSSSPLRWSYADIAKCGTPNSFSATLERVVTIQSHQYPPLPLPRRSVFECSVCGRTCASKRHLDIHSRNRHLDDTAFDDGASQETEDAGETESVESEKSGVSDACIASAECETESVESGESGENITKDREASAGCEMDTVTREEYGASDVKECRAGVDCDSNVTGVQRQWRKVKTKATCTVCSKIFKTSRALNIHTTMLHKQFKLAETSKVSSGKRNVTIQPTNIKKPPVKCSLCDRYCKNKQGLLCHIKKTHKYLDSDDDVAHQQDVDVEPDIEGSVSSHKSNVTTFPCNVCKKVFGTLRSVKMHESRKHKHKREQLQCGLCSSTFSSKRGLEKHTVSIHSVTNSSAVDKDEELLNTTDNRVPNSSADEITETQAVNAVINENFCCSICSREFKTHNGMRVHMSKMHKKDTTVKSTTTTPKQSLLEVKTTADKSTHNNNQFSITDQNASKHFTSDFSSIKELYKKYPPLRNSQLNEANSMHEKLKAYHDKLLRTVDNVSTEKVTNEIQDVIQDISQIDSVNRKFTWNQQDIDRLGNLNFVCKDLPVPSNWFWAAKDDSQQGIFNQKRMEFCVEKELESKVLHCKQCGSTGILVGLSQVTSDICVGCLEYNAKNSSNKRAKFKEAWDKVRPVDKTFPKRVEKGHETEELPTLTPGEKAVIAAVHPVVTVTKNFIANKKFKQESISLLHNSQQTWCKVLPRNDLQHRFMIIERRFKNSTSKYIIANAQKVKQWLHYLFKNHTEYIRMTTNKELHINNEALLALEKQSELAEVLYDEDPENCMTGDDEDGTVQAAMESGLSKQEVYTFDKYPNLYLKDHQIVKIKDKGKIEIIEDDGPRKPTYNTSANLCFPHLYCNGEMSPLDFGDYTLSRDLLKRQSLYAHRMADGSHKWQYGEDSIHMMHQYARLTEQTVHAAVGYYISQHPDSVHTPLESVLKAFKEGMNEDGLLDSQLPDLLSVMSKIPNSRQQWFCERLGIEAISRDLGDPNLFITLNMDPRAWPDVRQLVYQLEYGNESEMDENWFETNTERYTELMDKYAVQISIYLCRKAKIFLRAFFSGICRIPPIEVDSKSYKDSDVDWATADRFKNGWYWTRVEFTETRGVQHWHCLAKLPNVLDTALLGRIIHNGRVVRQELKCGNIREDKIEEAWNLIEMGLLASRYASIFTDSISLASFYSQQTDSDTHNADEIIDIEKLRQQFVNDYKAKNVSLATHPIMRKFNSPECDPNDNIENAKVASVSCMHHCITKVCGGDTKTGSGCRFSFPKRNMPCTVPAVMQVNANQMEAQMLLKRTCSRVPNLNKHFLKFWRANHDVTVLIDAAHKCRYATKYVSKTKKQTELMDEVIDYLGKRANDLMPPNLKQALNHLILADCSHRQFLSKQELSYKVMDLPEIRKSFNDVSIVGFYPRANLTQRTDEDGIVVFSDRTEYSAYGERCRDDTVLGAGLDKETLKSMCFRDFAETIGHSWILNKSVKAEPIDPKSRRKFKTRDINSGHWKLWRLRKRRHIRWSTVLYSEPAHLYEEIEQGKTTSQTLYFDLPLNKRRQLYRAYQELVCYRPWTGSPDESFLPEDVREKLRAKDPEAERRHSLMKLEAFQRVYKELRLAGEVAPEGSQWHRDNQYSYTMYLTNLHNSDMRLDRSANQGMFKARYEPADELVDCDVELRPPISDEMEESDMPSVLNFLPADTFHSILQQEPPAVSDIAVACPLNPGFMTREEMVRVSKASLFMADPPSPAIRRQNMSGWHDKAIELATSEKQQVLYIYGKAGTGKTEVALHICEHYKGRVQAGAGTGKAASNFNGPTVHAMFGWAHNQDSQSVVRARESEKLGRLREFYKKTEVFVIDEVNAMAASELGLLDETMCKLFDPERELKDKNGKVMPFGGRKMVFLGDAAQLRPVCGAAIYDSSVTGIETNSGRRRCGEYKRRTARGFVLYSDYLSKSCIWLTKGFRNKGLLLEIMDRIRDGSQTLSDLDKLLYQQRQYPNTQTAHGIHYSNESCSISNWLDLWETCKQHVPPRRLFISKASYHTDGKNDLVVSGLAALPPSQYHFAPDVLCVAEGCEVRLITNLNVSAGLANSATGTVVKVIYNNADVQALLSGQHPPAYCIIVNFPQFRGFLVGEERKFPLQNPHWVPLYRQRFLPQTVPGWIRKKQQPSLCYREQFPLDLCRHITAHRGQGQTWKNQLVSVDLGLESPNNHIPPDIASVVYVACTRTNKLQNLFISPIFPCIWERIGKSDVDKARRESELRLRNDAERFAEQHGWQEEFVEEQSYVPDYSENVNEWKDIVDATGPPVYSEESEHMESVDDGTSDLCAGDGQVPGWLRACERERHIGIDQGDRNFAMVAVDKTPDGLPRVVGAELYDLANEGLNARNARKIDAADLVLVLQNKTVLMNWIQQPGYFQLLPPVDRVIVHIEQVSLLNKYSKLFTVDMGRLLQQLCNVQNCIFKLSQPHIHRPTGPMFKLGDRIVRECKLNQNGRKRPADTVPVQSPAKRPKRQHSACPSDVEPDSSDSERETRDDAAAAQAVKSEYKRKKKMSTDIFRYFMHADFDQKMDLQVDVSDTLQEHWKELDSSRTVTKFDDLGDALLHALDEILCGSSNYRPLIPASPSLHVNRTVILTIMPDRMYWVVLQCTWNSFSLENMGVSDCHLPRHQKYSGRDTAEFIKDNLDQSLREALTQFTASNLYAEVQHIKIVVKQLQRYTQFRLTCKAAGALTGCTVAAMKMLCHESAGSDFRVSTQDGKDGSSYIVTVMPSENKLHIERSTGKHTNAILAFLEWSKEHIPYYVKQRRLRMNLTEKLHVFTALVDMASDDSSHQMEMLRLCPHVVALLRSHHFSHLLTRRVLADLLLIGLNKNCKYVSAVAPSYRQPPTRKRK